MTTITTMVHVTAMKNINRSSLLFFFLLVTLWCSIGITEGSSSSSSSSNHYRNGCTYSKVRCEKNEPSSFSILVHPENSFATWKYISADEFSSEKEESVVYIKIAKACRDLQLSSALDIFIDDNTIDGVAKSSLFVSAPQSSNRQRDVQSGRNSDGDATTTTTLNKKNHSDNVYDPQSCTVIDDGSTIKNDLNGSVASYFIKRSNKIEILKYLSVYEKKVDNLSFSRWMVNNRDDDDETYSYSPAFGGKHHQRTQQQHFHQCEVQVYEDYFSNEGYKWRIAAETNIDKWFKLSLKSRRSNSDSVDFSNLFSLHSDEEKTSHYAIRLIKNSKQLFDRAIFYLIKSLGLITHNEMDDLSYFFNPRILNDACRFLIYFEEMKTFPDGTRLVLELQNDDEVVDSGHQILSQFSLSV